MFTPLQNTFEENADLNHEVFNQDNDQVDEEQNQDETNQDTNDEREMIDPLENEQAPFTLQEEL